jgi:hypothetical protein
MARQRRFQFTTRLLVAFCLCVTVSAANASGKPVTGSRPNVVLVVIDALRADHLSFHGYEHETAPFLASLAAKGVVFEKAFAAATNTAPSSASLFTGLYPEQHGVVMGLFGVAKKGELKRQSITLHQLPKEVKTLGEVMKDAGYKTFAAHNNKNVGRRFGFHRGFDVFESNPSAEEAGGVNRIVQSWKSRLKEDEPYFFYIHYIDPHSPYRGRKPWYEGKRRGYREATMEKYDSEIRHVDEKLRELSDLYNWEKEALLIVTADHGEEFWDHGGTRHSRTLYDEVLRIPLVIYDAPVNLPPRRITHNVSNIDVLPTIMDRIGLPADQRQEGRSLLPAIRGENHGLEDREVYSYVASVLPVGAAFDGAESKLERKAGRVGRVMNPPLSGKAGQTKESSAGDEAHGAGVGTEEPGWGLPGILESRGPRRYIARAVILREMKLIINYDGSELLFNRSVDPGEKKNIAKSSPKVAARLRESLIRFHQTMRRFKTPDLTESLSEEELEKLRSLGYVH